MITPSFKKSLTRLFKDMVVADAWNDMVKRLQDIHKAIKEDVESRRFDLSYKTHSIVDSLRDQTEEVIRGQRKCVNRFQTLETSKIKTGDVIYLQICSPQGAAFNSRGSDRDICHEETRIAVLKLTENWCTNPEGEVIFWVNGGAAGTEKSTIARTFAQKLHEVGF